MVQNSKLIIADFSNVETKDDKAKKDSKKDSKKESKKSDTITNDDDGIKSSDTNTREEPIHRNKEESDTEMAELPLQKDDNNIKDDGNDAAASKQKDTRRKSRMSSLQQLKSLEQEGIMRAYTDTDKWHKVRYQTGFWKRQFSRSGTATGSKSDPLGLVLARVHFILQHPDQLPEYHVLHANCECVAVWCKTGHWSTLQGSSFLELTAAGQLKQSATIAATAAGSTATVTVPAAGIWGSWFGFQTTSTVSWLSLHPMAIPGLACYAAVTVGVPAMVYASAHKQWKETTERLSNAFWESATDNPEVFAECLTHWSEKE